MKTDTGTTVALIIILILIVLFAGCASIQKIVEAEAIYQRSHDIEYTNIGIQGQATLPGMIFSPGASIGYTKIIIHTGRDYAPVSGTDVPVLGTDNAKKD